MDCHSPVVLLPLVDWNSVFFTIHGLLIRLVMYVLMPREYRTLNNGVVVSWKHLAFFLYQT